MKRLSHMAWLIFARSMMVASSPVEAVHGVTATPPAFNTRAKRRQGVTMGPPAGRGCGDQPLFSTRRRACDRRNGRGRRSSSGHGIDDARSPGFQL